jgi:hypothetical protein
MPRQVSVQGGTMNSSAETVELVDGYAVPVDPMVELECDSCQ